MKFAMPTRDWEALHPEEQMQFKNFALHLAQATRAQVTPHWYAHRPQVETALMKYGPFEAESMKAKG